MARSPGEIAQRYEVVLEGVGDFLARNDLEVTDQKFARIARHVLAALDERDALTPFCVFNHLQNILEYNQTVIDSLDGEGFSGEALVHLVVSADRRTVGLLDRAKMALARLWRAKVVLLLLAATLLAAPLLARAYQVRLDRTTPISMAQAQELKEMVAQVVALGGAQSTASVWKVVKTDARMASYGPVGSYREFNRSQYRRAREILAERIQAAQNVGSHETEG